MKSNIQWNEVTWYSNIIAIVLFVGVFFLGMFIGQKYELSKLLNLNEAQRTQIFGSPNDIISAAFFVCKNTDSMINLQNSPQISNQKNIQKTIQAVFKRDNVTITLSDKRTMILPQAISASGARYANSDESFVFWNKGNTAFITEGIGDKSTTTYADCVVKNQ